MEQGESYGFVEKRNSEAQHHTCRDRVNGEWRFQLSWSTLPRMVVPVPAERLYKFRPLGIPESDQRRHTQDILLHHRFYCAPASSFNDPFECRFRISFDVPYQEKITYIAKWLQENDGLNLAQARKQAPDRLADAESGGADRVRNWIRNDIGMVCLVATKDDMLMWSHYADGHNGVCIEFTARTLLHAEFFGQASAVTYQDDLPVINYFRDDLMDRVRKSVYTKARSWSYECEYRLVVLQPPKSRLWDFDPLLVTAVYLGCKVSDKDCQLVGNWLKRRPGSPNLYRAKPANNTYQLEYKPYP